MHGWRGNDVICVCIHVACRVRGQLLWGSWNIGLFSMANTQLCCWMFIIAYFFSMDLYLQLKWNLYRCWEGWIVVPDFYRSFRWILGLFGLWFGRFRVSKRIDWFLGTREGPRQRAMTSSIMLFSLLVCMESSTKIFMKMIYTLILHRALRDGVAERPWVLRFKLNTRVLVDGCGCVFENYASRGVMDSPDIP